LWLRKEGRKHVERNNSWCLHKKKKYTNKRRRPQNKNEKEMKRGVLPLLLQMKPK